MLWWSKTDNHVKWLHIYLYIVYFSYYISLNLWDTPKWNICCKLRIIGGYTLSKTSLEDTSYFEQTIVWKESPICSKRSPVLQFWFLQYIKNKIYLLSNVTSLFYDDAPSKDILGTQQLYSYFWQYYFSTTTWVLLCVNFMAAALVKTLRKHVHRMLHNSRQNDKK